MLPSLAELAWWPSTVAPPRRIRPLDHVGDGVRATGRQVHVDVP